MSYQMTIEWWPLEKIVPYDRNPRIRTEKQIRDIALSILSYGWQNHLNVDEDGIIVTGHGRRLAALFLAKHERVGDQWVPVEKGSLFKLHPEGNVPVKVARGLPPEKIRQFRIADNKVAEGSGWDEDLLKLEMADLLSMLPDQIELTGFSMDEANKLLGLEVDGDDDGPPSEFKKADPDAPTQHMCPKCGYTYNKSTP